MLKRIPPPAQEFSLHSKCVLADPASTLGQWAVHIAVLCRKGSVRVCPGAAKVREANLYRGAFGWVLLFPRGVWMLTAVSWGLPAFGEFWIGGSYRHIERLQPACQRVPVEQSARAKGESACQR